MAFVSTLFAVFYAGLVLGMFFGLFWRGRSAPRKQPKQRSMAVDLTANARGPRVLCDPTVFDSHEDARDFLVRARDAGSV